MCRSGAHGAIRVEEVEEFVSLFIRDEQPKHGQRMPELVALQHAVLIRVALTEQVEDAVRIRPERLADAFLELRVGRWVGESTGAAQHEAPLGWLHTAVTCRNTPLFVAVTCRYVPLCAVTCCSERKTISFPRTRVVRRAPCTQRSDASSRRNPTLPSPDGSSMS